MKYKVILNNIRTFEQERMHVTGEHPVETFAQVRKQFPSADWRISDIIEVRAKKKKRPSA